MIGPFSWSDLTGQYRQANGRFVSRREVRAALDRAIDNAEKRMLAVSSEFRLGTVSLETWRNTMAAGLKDVHLYSAAAARGGWAQMSARDFGRVGKILQKQYAYLNNFTTEIVAGIQPLDGRFAMRVKLYVQRGRSTYHITDREVQKEHGMSERRNILNPGDSCDGCVEMRDLGWVSISDPSYIEIGDRNCLANCRCDEEYR